MNPPVALALALMALQPLMAVPGQEPAVSKTTAVASDADFLKIKERYLRFLTGSRSTFTGEWGEKASRQFQKAVAGPVRRAMEFDFAKDADVTFLLFEAEPGYKEKHAVASSLLEQYVLALAYAYTVDAPGNAGFHDPKIRECYLQCLDYLHRRGIREGMTFHNNRQRMAMEGAPQPKDGASNLARMELRMGAFCQSVLLMESAIRDTETFRNARNLVKHLEMLGFTSGHVRYYEPGTNPPGFEDLVQSDAIQTYSDTTLVSALLESDPKRRSEMLRKAHGVFTDSLKIVPGWEDTIKPDFTGYHHRGIYGNYYTCGFIPQAAFGVYLLEGTPYAVDPASKSNLRELIKTYRLYCQKYSMPFSIRGRMPGAGDTLRDQVFPGIVILASDLGLGDKEMKGVFARLWDPGVVGIDFLFTGGRGKLFRGMGALDMLVQLLEENPPAENDPSGFWSKPYGGMAIHRRSQWMTAVKGFSKYIWDYENGPPDENLYGQYLSHGSLVIFSKGSPVSDRASGYDVTRGWDWYRMPGTTVVHFPMQPRGITTHREFGTESFLGSVSADGVNGAFGMILNDSTFPDGVKIDLKARKSVFFMDDFLLMLGSGIRGGDGKHPVETTLFQSVLQTGQTFSFAPGELADPAGNRYYLPAGAALKRFTGVQESYREDGKSPSKGEVAVAWLDHGLHPENASYEIGIGIAGAAKRSYTILRQDDSLHCVAFPEDKVVFQIFYQAGEGVREKSPVAKVSTPCLVMTKTTGSGCRIGVTNPDLGMVDTDVAVTFKWLAGEKAFLPSRIQPVELTLSGKWKLATPANQVRVIPGTGPGTQLRFECINGLELQADLVPGE